jgi:hypothetical protein
VWSCCVGRKGKERASPVERKNREWLPLLWMDILLYGIRYTIYDG